MAGGEHANLGSLSVAQLKGMLLQLGLPTVGRKAQLIERLGAANQLPRATPLKRGADGLHIVPGTAAVGRVATAEEAALEKIRAGENRAVEHVALSDMDTEALLAAINTKSRFSKLRRLY